MEQKDRKENEVREEEISLEDLSEVAGGSGLRHVKKEETYDVSDSITERI